MSVEIAELPLSRCEVAPVVSAHLERFAAVLQDALTALDQVRVSAAAQMAVASASSRGMLVSDFILEPAHRHFGSVRGVSVGNRFGRPWINLAGGRVQVRFRKLTTSLQICVSDSERATRLAYHLGDPALPGMPEATILTAGYVLDASELTMDRLVLVCHIGNRVHYSIDLPGGAAATRPPVQLPLVPLSAPIIRSARAAAAQRLARPAGTDG